MLIWARERCGALLEDAAKRVGVDPARVRDWEEGVRAPSARQARQLADFYDVPFLEFFSKNPLLSSPTIVPDFRSTFHARPTARQQFAISEVQGWAEENRLNALSLAEMVGDAVPRFPEALYASTNDDPEVMASRARTAVGLRAEEQIFLKSEDRRTFPQVLRSHLERLGILVLKQGGIQQLGIRGICIFDPVLPVIVYGNEAPGAQAFTMAHELGHIVLRQSGVSGPPRMGGKVGLRLIETWCNKFAAAFLMPKELIVADVGQVGPAQDTITDERLKALSDRYAVSRHAMLIRLVCLGVVKSRFYWFVKRPQFLAEEQEFRAFGRPRYYGQRYRSSRGDYYTSLVLEAWAMGRISNHNAAEFMGIKKLSHLDDIRANFG